MKTERVALEHAADLVIRSLKDRQQFADPDGDAAAVGISSAMWSHFGQVWPSGRILAEHVGRLDVAGRRVLELGCGLGLASLVLHRAGVDVTASDVHPLARAFLGANVALNALLPLPYRSGNWTLPEADLGRFGLLVGSDVLYERTHARALSAFVDAHAEAHAEVVIVDPSRGHRAEFKRLMADLAFTSVVVVAPARVFDGVPYRGQILTFRREPAPL